FKLLPFRGFYKTHSLRGPGNDLFFIRCELKKLHAGNNLRFLLLFQIKILQLGRSTVLVCHGVSEIKYLASNQRWPADVSWFQGKDDHFLFQIIKLNGDSVILILIFILILILILPLILLLILLHRLYRIIDSPKWRLDGIMERDQSQLGTVYVYP